MLPENSNPSSNLVKASKQLALSVGHARHDRERRTHQQQAPLLCLPYAEKPAVARKVGCDVTVLANQRSMTT
jgi:hypothetical protein